MLIHIRPNLRRETRPDAAPDIAALIDPASVIPNLRAGGKRQTLRALAAQAAAATGLPERAIFEALFERERLGTTGIGDGVAIPHAKLPGLDRLYGLFARLERPVDFEAIDGRPVDLVFLLLAPDAAGARHIKALAGVSRLLRDRTVCEMLRGADSAEALYAVLTDGAAARTKPERRFG